MKKTIWLAAAILLAACGTDAQQDEVNEVMMIKEEYPVEFNYEEVFFDFSDYSGDQFSNLDFRNFYKNKIYLVEVVDEDIYYYSNRLYTYDLENNELTEIKDIIKQDEKNRIYDFLQLKDNKYLYTEITTNKEIGDFGVVYYETYIQENDERQLVSFGYTDGTLIVPMSIIKDDNIYLVYRKKGYDEMTKMMTGKDTVEVIRVDADSQDIIYKNDFEKLDRNQLFFDSDGLRLLIRSNGNYDLINLENKNDIIRIWEDEEDEYHERAIPVDDHICFSVFNPYTDEIFKSYFILKDGSKKEYNTHTYRYADYVQLGDITIAITNDCDLIMLAYENDELYIKDIEDLKGAIYFRKIDDQSVVIFKGNEQRYLLTLER